MCKKRNSIRRILRGHVIRLDNCIAKEVMDYNEIGKLNTVASCCGHGRYRKSVIFLMDDGSFFELYSRRVFPKGTKTFYRIDSNGFYHLKPFSKVIGHV